MLSNSWSPTNKVTICTVTVVTDSKGLAVNLADKPAAITTIIVSPIARDIANIKEATMPGRAAGIITFLIVSDLVAPTPYDASRRLWGTALITSSDREEIKGIIIIPITKPAAKALSEEALNPKLSQVLLINGPTTKAAKNP